MTLITLFFVIYVTTTTIRKKINIFCTSKIEVEEQEKGNQARKIGKKVCVHYIFLCLPNHKTKFIFPVHVVYLRKKTK